MVRIEEKVDEKRFRRVRDNLSDYERNKEINTPTHYTMEVIQEGKYKGFDAVKYYIQN